MIVPKTKNKKQLADYMIEFIKENNMTSSVFQSLEILNEDYIVDKIHHGKTNPRTELLRLTYDAKSQFNIQTQQDQSIFAPEPEKEDDQMDLSADTLVFTCPLKKMEHICKFQASEFQVLQDVSIHVYDESLR